MTGWTGELSLSAAELAVALGQPSPTEAQQRVIEAPAGPALVVAGAGSGKTETMAGRVVWLVANGHVHRDEVLGLTFTRKAAGELAERIRQRLAVVDEFGRRGLLPHLTDVVSSGALTRVAAASSGSQRERVRAAVLDELADYYRTGWDPSAPRQAEEIMIRPRVSTYNAFADSVVREHAARIGRDPDAAVLSQSAAWLLARSVVYRSDDPDLEQIERSPSGVIDAVQRLAADVLDHRADLADVESIATSHAAAFTPYRERKVVDDAAKNLEAMPVLTRLAAEYAAEKSRRGVLDFADQVSGAYDIVEGSLDVAEALRAQYRVVLLDEYQDTSVIQTRFLAALFRDTAVMAVGDPHQSIYGWRGASADNLYSFAEEFAHEERASTFSLVTSWRNDRRILDVANRVLLPLQRAELRVPELEPRPDAGTGSVEVRFPLTVEDEAAEVAAWFARRREEGDATESGAILFRSKKHMQTFASALGRRGVPHRILGLGGLLSTPEVVDVVSALRVVHDPSAGSALIRLLVGPRFAVGIADMAALYDLASALAGRDGSLTPLPDEVQARLRTSPGLDEAVSIIDAVDFVRSVDDGYRMLSAITPLGRERLREAGEMFERLRRASTQPILELIRTIEIELRLDIELATNETRGPARSAATQLRAFADEVRTFLAADDRGTIGSLLAWLDKAERADELMPRSEPPEPGVVQLLTIHGAKGLEWDHVAVVRMVDDELPSVPKEAAGWFGFGVLPFALRGDRAALPVFSWDPVAEMAAAGDDPKKRHKAALDALGSGMTKARPAGGALERFKAEYRDYQQQEERRLAYVAVTRARSRLLLTGAHWAGQQKPRDPSPFLREAIEVCALAEIEVVDPSENPYEGVSRTRVWPADPLGARRPAVEQAAAEVRAALASDQTPEPTTELSRLLRERERRRAGLIDRAPIRVPASRFKDYLGDFGGTVRSLARPMPERPYAQTRIGTLFHAWVEHRSGIVGAARSLDDALWEGDGDEAARSEIALADDDTLARLRRTFEASEWGTLSPIAVELEIDFALGAGREREEDTHLVICKLDAVYRRDDRDGRIEIVDWKTGRAPQTTQERDERMLQLALYRLAYHRRFGVPLEQIDVALYYVADDLVIRGDRIYSESELFQRWSAARAAR